MWEGINEGKEEAVMEKQAKKEIEEWRKWINGFDHVKTPGEP